MKPGIFTSLVSCLVCATTLNAASASGGQQPASTPSINSSNLIAQTSWQTFTPKDGTFTVQVPIAVTRDTSSTTVVGKTLQWNVYKARQGSSLYAVAYTDLPLSALSAGRDVFMESIKNKLLAKDFDWNTLAEQGQRINLGDIPGKEYLSLRRNRVSALRIYLVNLRLYGVFASADSAASVSQFMDSFSVESVWRPFVSKDGRFSVHLPMAPLVTNETTPYKGKPITWKKFEARNIYAKDDSYVVAYTDLAPTQREANAVLTELTTATLTTLGVPELSKQGRAISLNGNPGREFMGTTSDGHSMVMRFYLIGDRVYGVFINTQSLTNLNQFLSSFQPI